MSRWVIAPHGLIEPVSAPEFFVTGIGAAELLDSGGFRFYLINQQLPIEAPNGQPQRVLQCRIVGPAMRIPKVISQLATCMMAREPAEEIPPQPARPRVVK